jgi:hypothetical protein
MSNKPDTFHALREREREKFIDNQEATEVRITMVRESKRKGGGGGASETPSFSSTSLGEGKGGEWKRDSEHGKKVQRGFFE